MLPIEDKCTELKREMPQKDQIVKTAVAFANGGGGRIVVGIDGNKGLLVGIDADEFSVLEEKLSNSIYDLTEPHIIPHITLKHIADKAIINIDVSEGLTPPYYYTREGKENGVYIRVGSATRRADKAIIHDLELKARNITFDATPVYNTDEKTLSKEVLSDFLEERRRVRGIPLQKIGKSLYKHYRIIVSGGKTSVGGTLCFSKKVEDLMSYATIQCARFKGLDEREYLDEAEFSGHLIRQIEDAIIFTKKHIQKRMIIKGTKRIEQYEYPPSVLREMIVNAVCHRDYSRPTAKTRLAIYDDRIECINPGDLLPGLNIEDLGQGVSEIRNPVIAKILKDWGYIEEWGKGISKMITELKEAGLPRPVFTEKGLFFQVILSSVSYELTENERVVLDYIQKHGTVRARDLELELKLHRNTILNILSTLIKNRLIVKEGKGKSQYYRTI